MRPPVPGASPALRVSLLLAAGIALGDALLGHVPCAAVAGLWLTAAAVLVSRRLRESGVASMVAALLVVTTGAGRFLCEETIRSERPGLREGKGTVIGIVGDVPQRTSRRLRFPIDVSFALDTAGGSHVSARVLASVVRGAGPLPVIEEGMQLRLTGLLSRPARQRNPGEPDMERARRLQGISMLMAVRETDECTVLGSSSGGGVVACVVGTARSHALGLIDRTVGGEEGEFLKGLLLGERSGIPTATQQAFVNSGVAHILAVSGSNVAVVAMAASMLFRLLRVPRRLCPVPVSIVLLFYMLLTRSEPPVVRATVMALVLLWASRGGVRTGTLNLIGVAALAILSVDVRDLFDAGFQLSFAAVLAIVTLTPVTLKWIRADRAPRPARAALGAGAMSFAASVGTLPLGAAMFGRVSLVGVLVNLAVVPASGVSVALGMVTLGADLVDPGAASVFGAANRLLLGLTLELARWAGGLPFAFIETADFSAAFTISYLALVALVFFFDRPDVVRAGAMALAAGLNLTLLEPPLGRLESPPSRLRLSVIDVGQGDAVLVQAPDGMTTLIDAGPATPVFDTGERILVPLMRRMGLTHIDQVVLTHGHDDHAGGLPSIARAIPVGRVVSADSSDVPQEVIGILHLLRRGDSLAAGHNVRVYALAPEAAPGPVGHTAGQESGANERSLVLRLVYGDVSFLLTGDAERATEEGLIRRYGDFLHADVLKVAHHGGRGGTSDAFLARVRPSIAVISVGAYNRHGHPSPEVLLRLNGAGARVLRTDRDGAVILETDGRTLEVVSWR